VAPTSNPTKLVYAGQSPAGRRRDNVVRQDERTLLPEAQATGEPADGVRQATGEAADRVRQAAGHPTNRVRQPTRHPTNGVRQAAGHPTNRVGDTTDDAAHRAGFRRRGLGRRVRAGQYRAPTT